MENSTEMSKLPKLLVKNIYYQHLPAVVYSLEQARYLFGNSGGLVSLDGNLINSYEKLVQIAIQHKDKEFLEVLVAPIIGGG